MLQAPMGQMGPAMHPVMQNQPQQQQQPNPVQQNELKYDIVTRVKALIWSLKESLANVMKVAGTSIYQTAAGKSNEEAPPKIEKALEDFFSICNQIELHLRTIQECAMQQKDSMQYLPLQVALGKNDVAGAPPQDNLSYTQYLSTIKGQVTFAKAVQEMLNEGARKVGQAD